LTAKPYARPVGQALRYSHLEVFPLPPHIKGNAFFPTRKNISQRKFQDGLLIRAFGRRTLSASKTGAEDVPALAELFLIETRAEYVPAIGLSEQVTSSKEGLKEVAEDAAPFTAVTPAFSNLFEYRLPSGRWCKFLAVSPTTSEGIVFFSLFRITENLVGFIYFLKPLISPGRRIGIGVILPCKLL